MKNAMIFLVLLTLVCFCGCSGGGSGTSPAKTTDTAFYIQAQARTGSDLTPLDGVTINGRFGTATAAPSPMPTSTLYDFTTYTNQVGMSPEITGFAYEPVPEIVGIWISLHAACYNASNLGSTTTVRWENRGDTLVVYCPVNAPLTANPASIDVTNLPSTITLTGADMVGTYGTPKVQIFDEFGDRVADLTAASYASDGSSVTINTPSDMGSLYNGTYAVVVYALQADNSYWSTSGASLALYGGNDPPPFDPPPCFQCGMTCTDYDCAVSDCQAAGGVWLSWGCVCQAP